MPDNIRSDRSETIESPFNEWEKSLFEHEQVDDSFQMLLKIKKTAFWRNISGKLNGYFCEDQYHDEFAELQMITEAEYRQAYLNKVISYYVREILINSVIYGALPGEKAWAHQLSISDKIMDTKEYESRYGYEFSNVSDGVITAYRYSYISSFDINRLKREGIKKITIIDWNDFNLAPDVVSKRILASNNSISIISARDFLAKIMGKKNAEVYLLYVRELIKRTRAMYVRTSVPKLTSTYNITFRIDCENELRRELERICSAREKIIDSQNIGDTTTYSQLMKGYQSELAVKGSSNGKDLENRSIKLCLETDILDVYLEQKLYRALTGTAEYAASFMTAEYLYWQYSEDEIFDYTVIVAGYLKSIEQLMHKLASYHIGKTCTIKKRNCKAKSKELTKQFLKEGTAGVYCELFNQNRFMFRDSIDDDSQQTILDCIDRYIQDCRNDSFHKNNHYDWSYVERVRFNTFFLYMVLLGGLSIKETEQESIESMGIITDDRLEKIYYEIQQRRLRRIKIIPAEGDDVFDAAIVSMTQFPTADVYGRLDKMEIRCKQVNKDANDRRDSTYLITRDNIPYAIYYGDHGVVDY